MWRGPWLGTTVTSYLGLQPAQLSATTEPTILAHLNDEVTAIVDGRWHWWWPVRHHLGFHV